MSTYLCEGCEELTDEPIELPVREHYAMGDALVPHDYVELRCPCGSDCLIEITPCRACGEARAAQGFDECEHCVALSFINDPQDFDDFARIHAGKPVLEQVQSWITREFRADLECGRATV